MPIIHRRLDRLESIVPAVQALGHRHAGYGVKDEDYATVGEALLLTFGQGLGDSFTDDTCEAWALTHSTSGFRDVLQIFNLLPLDSS